MHRLIAIAVGVSLLAVAGTANAQADFVGVRALGMGEARRAIATGAEGILLNPSGMSLTRGYTIEAIYGFKVEDVQAEVVSRDYKGLVEGLAHEGPHLKVVTAPLHKHLLAGKRYPIKIEAPGINLSQN